MLGDSSGARDDVFFSVAFKVASRGFGRGARTSDRANRMITFAVGDDKATMSD